MNCVYYDELSPLADGASRRESGTGIWGHSKDGAWGGGMVVWDIMETFLTTHFAQMRTVHMHVAMLCALQCTLVGSSF